MNEQQTREQIEQLQAERQQILEQPAGYPGRTEVLAMIGTDLRKAERRLAAFELERNTCTTHGRVRCDECQPERIAPGQLEPADEAHAFEPGDGITVYADVCAACGRHLSEHPEGHPAELEICGCPRQGRPDGRGWHLDTCRHRQLELEQPAHQLPAAGPAEQQGELADEAAQSRHLVAAGAVWLLRQLSAEAERMADELRRKPRASRRQGYCGPAQEYPKRGTAQAPACRYYLYRASRTPAHPHTKDTPNMPHTLQIEDTPSPPSPPRRTPRSSSPTSSRASVAHTSMCCATPATATCGP
jgi:hypothetical protein